MQHVAAAVRRPGSSITRVSALTQPPRLDTADARARDQPREVAIAALVARKKGRRVTVHLQLRADDRLDALRVRLEGEADDAAQIRRVGQTERAVAERGRPRDQLLGAARPVTEGVGAVGSEFCVHRVPAVRARAARQGAAASPRLPKKTRKRNGYDCGAASLWCLLQCLADAQLLPHPQSVQRTEVERGSS